MSKENITVNGRVYRAKELDFNFLCSLGDNGIDISDIDKKMLPALRVYVAFCMDTSVEEAGDELSRHIIGGGNFEDIVSTFGEKAEDSDFFRALNKTAPKATPKRNTKSKGEEVSE
jgi:hypothetical protein